jgi:hypothetical protein
MAFHGYSKVMDMLIDIMPSPKKRAEEAAKSGKENI